MYRKCNDEERRLSMSTLWIPNGTEKPYETSLIWIKETLSWFSKYHYFNRGCEATNIEK
jgi:hypothetical protein